jgi:hypothetical protein
MIRSGARTFSASPAASRKPPFFAIDGERINGLPEQDADRTTAEGKASSVQFVHFPFTAAQVERFRAPGAQVSLGFGHPRYGHMAVLPQEARAALANDFD